jgi:hypothetical protein
VEGECLLVCEGQDEPPAGAVFRVEDLGDAGTASRLPELDRRQDGREPLLRADRFHAFADDLFHLAVDAPPERREGPESRRELPDESGADEQLVADGLRVGRRLAQGREMQL